MKAILNKIITVSTKLLNKSIQLENNINTNSLLQEEFNQIDKSLSVLIDNFKNYIIFKNLPSGIYSFKLNGILLSVNGQQVTYNSQIIDITDYKFYSQNQISITDFTSEEINGLIFIFQNKQYMLTSQENIILQSNKYNMSIEQYILNSFIFNSDQWKSFMYSQTEQYIIINSKLYVYDNNQLKLINEESGWTCISMDIRNAYLKNSCYAIKNNILYKVEYDTSVIITQIVDNVKYICGSPATSTVGYILNNENILIRFGESSMTQFSIQQISSGWIKICGLTYFEAGGGKTCGFGIREDGLYVLHHTSIDPKQISNIVGWKFITGVFEQIYYDNTGICSYGWAIDLNDNLYYLTDTTATQIGGVSNCRFVYSMDLFAYAITNDGLYYINNLQVSKIDSDPNWTHINNKIGIKNNKLYSISGSEILPLQTSMNWTDISILSTSDGTSLAVGNSSLYKINKDKSIEKIF